MRRSKRRVFAAIVAMPLLLIAVVVIVVAGGSHLNQITFTRIEADASGLKIAFSNENSWPAPQNLIQVL